MIRKNEQIGRKRVKKGLLTSVGMIGVLLTDTERITLGRKTQRGGAVEI